MKDSGFIAYKVGLALEMVPGQTRRQWMDESQDRFAYRCLPLTIANGSGWELLSPCDFEATWDGGKEITSIKVRCLDDFKHFGRVVMSHFGEGVLTIHTGYLFRTNPGVGMLVRGAPNFPTDGIQALEGLVETDWLAFPFTMNWIFTRPGTVVFNKGDPVAFLCPVVHAALERSQPVIRSIDAAPKLKGEYQAWSKSRETFIKGLDEQDPTVVKQGWQRNYMQGRAHSGEKMPTHMTQRKLKKPQLID
jgi:Family of unknown function (DUF6065)